MYLACISAASASVKPLARIIMTQLDLVTCLAPKKVGSNLTGDSCQLGLGDGYGGLLVGSDSFFPAKGNKSAQLKICLQHSLMDQGESSIVTV